MPRMGCMGMVNSSTLPSCKVMCTRWHCGGQRHTPMPSFVFFTARSLVRQFGCDLHIFQPLAQRIFQQFIPGCERRQAATVQIPVYAHAVGRMQDNRCAAAQALFPGSPPVR